MVTMRNVHFYSGIKSINYIHLGMYKPHKVNIVSPNRVMTRVMFRCNSHVADHLSIIVHYNISRIYCLSYIISYQSLRPCFLIFNYTVGNLRTNVVPRRHVWSTIPQIIGKANLVVY